MNVSGGRLTHSNPSDRSCLSPDPPSPSTVIWLLCHYPDTEECDERVRAAARLQRSLGVPIWVFGSVSAQYPESVERMIKAKLLNEGTAEEMVVCSTDRADPTASLDTFQEAVNIMTAAEHDGVLRIYAVSNRLQLWQVRGLFRGKPFRLTPVPTPLRDRRWWYVTARVLLIPLAFLGIGKRFPLLVLTRWARGRLSWYPF